MGVRAQVFVSVHNHISGRAGQSAVASGGGCDCCGVQKGSGMGCKVGRDCLLDGVQFLSLFFVAKLVALGVRSIDAKGTTGVAVIASDRYKRVNQQCFGRFLRGIRDYIQPGVGHRTDTSAHVTGRCDVSRPHVSPARASSARPARLWCQYMARSRAEWFFREVFQIGVSQAVSRRRGAVAEICAVSCRGGGAVAG